MILFKVIFVQSNFPFLNIPNVFPLLTTLMEQKFTRVNYFINVFCLHWVKEVRVEDNLRTIILVMFYSYQLTLYNIGAMKKGARGGPGPPNKKQNGANKEQNWEEKDQNGVFLGYCLP